MNTRYAGCGVGWWVNLAKKKRIITIHTGLEGRLWNVKSLDEFYIKLHDNRFIKVRASDVEWVDYYGDRDKPDFTPREGLYQ